MSLINLFFAARKAFGERRRRQRAYQELTALDDRSLADIGIHRSQIPAIVEGVQVSTLSPVEPANPRAPALNPSGAWLAAGHR